MSKINSEKILFVDDDANLLAACERNLRRQFQVETANSGEAALQKLAERGPFAVVVVDRHMPGMDGIDTLAAIRERFPDTVRIMLTGNADLEAAIQVVNDGNIFRFLTKPCPVEILGKAIEDALKLFRLAQAEKELLNKTLSGSIKLLTEILSTLEPQSFGRAQSMREVINHVAKKFQLQNEWEIHVAVMLAPIGNVTIPPETLIRARTGEVLSKVEEQLVTQVPEIAARLLANIPRLEGVSRIVRYHRKQYDGMGFPPDSIAGDAIPAGSRLLKILNDLEHIQSGGMPRQQALDEMLSRTGWYDPALLEEVRSYHGFAAATPDQNRPSISIDLEDLAPGMVLRSNVETKEGTLILSAGHQITDMTLEKIQNFDRVSGIKVPIFVVAPETTGHSSPAPTSPEDILAQQVLPAS